MKAYLVKSFFFLVYIYKSNKKKGLFFFFKKEGITRRREKRDFELRFRSESEKISINNHRVLKISHTISTYRKYNSVFV